MKTNYIKTALLIVIMTFSVITKAQSYLTDESSGVLPEDLTAPVESISHSTAAFTITKNFDNNYIQKRDISLNNAISDLELSVIVNQTRRYTKNNYSKVELNIPVQEETSKSNSIFSSEVFYFVTAAVLAGAGYLIWKDNATSEEASSKTFGLPPKP